ncbi:MAG: MBOAT family O-acyltransferase [Siphonobacter sp.]
MIFNSIEFLIFFPIVVLLYYTLPHRFRWFMLLIASCYFYMAFIPIYIVILGATIVIDYFAGIWIEQSVGHKRKLFLVLSLIANLGILAVFKYYNFFADNVNFLVGPGHRHLPLLKILLPVGLSFHTFQAMSYTIEVYRGNQYAERHFGIYALYVMFFPQLVAGPIERPQNMLHQFHEKHTFNYAQTIDGLRWIYWGLFKKMVVADRLSMYVDPVFNSPDPSRYGSLATAGAAAFFAIQIYCDFSGYSDVAIGTAKILGFKLMENFKRPYIATNIQMFWARWHISLSTWFKDYVYIPLGGNRKGRLRRYFNVSIVFLISGLWHGANWTYLIWGGLHSVFNLITMIGRDSKLVELPNRWWVNFICILATFSLVTFAWIFFRANSVHDAFTLIDTLFSWRGWKVELDSFNYWVMRTGDFKPPFRMIISLLVLFLLGLGDLLIEYRKDYLPTARLKVMRPVLYSAMVIFFILFALFDTAKQFIYFQF